MVRPYPHNRTVLLVQPDVSKMGRPSTNVPKTPESSTTRDCWAWYVRQAFSILVTKEVAQKEAKADEKRVCGCESRECVHDFSNTHIGKVDRSR